MVQEHVPVVSKLGLLTAENDVVICINTYVCII